MPDATTERRQWREDFRRSNLYRQRRGWTQAGIWDVMLEALNETGPGAASVQMIDASIIRAISMPPAR